MAYIEDFVSYTQDDCTTDDSVDIVVGDSGGAIAPKVGMTTSGSGVTAGSTVAEVVDATHIKLSTATSGGGATGVTLTFGPANEHQFVVEGRCEFFGMQVSRYTDGIIILRFSNQSGTPRSSATYDDTKELLRLDLGDTGSANMTPVTIMLPGGTSILFDTGMALNTDTGSAIPPNTMTVFYRQ
jgi:hypothetical protein